MRIWIIAENWPPRIGGIERYLTGLSSHLSEHTITVITPESGEIANGTVIHRRFFYPMWPRWYPLYRFLSKKAFQETPDLVICGKALVEGRIARKLQQKYKIPYIVCTYGMEIATWSNIPRVRKQLISVLLDADRILYINTKTKDDLVALGVPNERCMRLYPGITPHLLDQKSSDDILERHGITKPYILCVARLVKRKGIDDLIEAYSHLQTPLQLVIAGDGPERSFLERHTKTVGVSVTFTGSVSDEELHTLYAHASLFALTPKELPHDYEGFGIVYSEAAYYGLPIVATKTGGVPEAVENGVTGVLALPNHPKSILESMETLLTNPELARQYGEAGRKWVLERFTWQATMKDLKVYIHSLAKD